MSRENDYSGELPPKLNGILSPSHVSMGLTSYLSDTQRAKESAHQPIRDRTTMPPVEQMGERLALIKKLLPENSPELERDIQHILDRVWEIVGEMDSGISLYVLNRCLISSQRRAKDLLARQIEGLCKEIEEASSRLEELKGDYLKIEKLEGLC